MKKEDIALVAQLLTSMRDAVEKLAEAEKDKDSEKLSAAKKEILNFQNQIEKIL